MPLGAPAGIVTALIVFELILRQFYWGLETWRPGVGWGYYATELRRYFFEGGATSHWDARGVRVIPGPTPPGPPIVVVGNSITQAAQVGDDQVFTALLQRQLRLPVDNIGHDSQTLAEDVYEAQEVMREFRPAWTIVQFRPDDFEEQPARSNRPRFELAGGRLQVVTPAIRYGRIAPLRRQSALINVGLFRLAVLRDTPMPPLFRAADPRPEMKRHYGPVEVQLDAVYEAYHGRVTMFLVPDFLPPATAIEARLDRWCREKNASCVNFRDVFDEFQQRGRAPTGFSNSGFGLVHFNPEGHVAAARLLTAEMERLRARGLF